MTARLSDRLDSRYRVFFSFRIGAYRLGGSGTIPLGLAHYSHALAARRILKAISLVGAETQELIRPELYSAEVAFESLKQFRPGDVHVIFKPIEEIRILRGAYNIACIIWEFDQLNERPWSGHPFSNHTRILRAIDEVWCYCTFTRDIVSKYFSNVHLLPPPFDAPGGRGELPARTLPFSLSEVQALRPALNSFGPLRRIFSDLHSADFIVLSIFNPLDPRKNAGSMVRAFSLFQCDKPGAVLLLKLVVDNVSCNLSNVLSVMEAYCRRADFARNVVVITEQLSGEAMIDLYRLADFYLCTSHCEGLGMPIIEAMGHGIIPISVNNTAMADYIDEDGAFVVPSCIEPARLDSNNSCNPNLTWYRASTTAIALALERAYRSSAETRRSKRNTAINTVQTRYSMDKALRVLDERLRAVRSRHLDITRQGTT
jgi:glycosyltransferase involved in cell wall biosynthesis